MVRPHRFLAVIPPLIDSSFDGANAQLLFLLQLLQCY